MTRLLLIAAGGAVGALLRYFVAGVVHRIFDATFPWGTLVANVSGSFLIGLLWALSERAPFPPPVASFVFVGVLGAYTTFSTYGLESLNLICDGEVGLGVANVLASNVLGLAAVFAGFVCARALFLYGRP